MFSWGKSEKQVLVIANVQHLKSYHEIVTRKDTDVTISKGDYVTLKSQPFIQDTYAGCAVMGKEGEARRYHGYVLNINKSDSDKHVSLGGLGDMKLAVVGTNNKVHFVQCDSRMFCKTISRDINPILRQFVEDLPIQDIKIGALVRPRANTVICKHHHKFSSFSSSKMDSETFKTPLLILNTEADKVILAGVVANSFVEEITVDKDLLCPYTE
jgi:hypothetical protein